MDFTSGVRWLPTRWLREFYRRIYGPIKQLKRRRRAFRQPSVERLEDRTLLSGVTVDYNASNNYSILGTVGDTVWLKTNDTTHNIQFSTDGTNYGDLVATTLPGAHPAGNVNSDATIVLGGLGNVHIVSMTGQGHAIQLQALGAASGSAATGPPGQLASPSSLTIDGNVNTEGGNLSILNIQMVEVKPNVTVSSRNIGASTDFLNAPSIGDSGAIKITATNPDTLNPVLNIDFNHPTITVDSGARILAQATGAFKAGDVTLSTANTNYTINTVALGGGLLGSSILARQSNVALDGATIKGATIDLSSHAGDIDLLGLLTSAAAAAGPASGFFGGVGTFTGASIFSTLGSAILQATPVSGLIADVASLPVTFLFKKADATVETGQGSAQAFNTNVNSATGEITLAQPSSFATGDAVTYSSGGGTPITGLTSGATYFVIWDSSTTVRLATSLANAQAGVAITGINGTGASASQSLAANTQITGADVSLGTDAESDAEGLAVYMGSFEKLLGSFGFAFAVGIGIPNAQTLVDSGTQIVSTGDVHVTSNSTSTTENTALIAQNLGGEGSDEGYLGIDGQTIARTQLAAALGVDVLTAHSTVSQYAAITAEGNAVITASGDNTNKNTVLTASYFDGNAGGSVDINVDTASIAAYVDGTVTSGTAADIGNSQTKPATISFNPSLTVHSSNDTVEPNTIDFGTTNPDFNTGDEITYDSGLGGPIDGLIDGATYYVVNTGAVNDYRIQLTNSRADALAKPPTNIVQLNPNPTLTDTSTGTTLPFTDVKETVPLSFPAGSDVSNNQIDFQLPHGFTTGEEVTYTTTGNAVGGLNNNGKYFVYVVNPTTIELYSSMADALAGNLQNVIQLDPTQAAGDQEIAPTGSTAKLAFQPAPRVDDNAHTIDFGFNHGFTSGDKATYTTTGTAITPLQSGSTYFVVKVNDTTIELDTSYADAISSNPTQIIPITGATTATGTQTITALTPIDFGFMPQGINNGDTIVYHGIAGKQVNGLTDGHIYYAVVDPNYPDQVVLSASQNGTPITLSLNPTLTSGGNTYTITSIDTNSNSFIFDPALNYTFTAGQPVVYHGALGTKIAGLNDGQTYYAIVDVNNPYSIQLALTPDEAKAASVAVTNQNTASSVTSSLVPVNGGAVGTILSVDPRQNAIVCADPAPNFSTGEAVVFHQAPNNGISPLVDGTTYYAVPVAGDPNTVQLALDQQSANQGSVIKLDASSQLTGTTQTLDVISSDPTTSTLILLKAPSTPVTTGDAFKYHAAVGNGIQGLVDGNTYYAIAQADPTTLQVASSPGGAPLPLSAVLTDANGNNLLIQSADGKLHTITLYAPLSSPIQSGDPLVYHANGATIAGLMDGNKYYVVNNQPGGINPITFSFTAVAPAGSAIHIPHHGFYTGEQVTYSFAAGGSAIGGLTNNTPYFAIVLDVNTIELAASPANAQSGQAMTFSTVVASGTQTFTPPASAGSPVSFSPSTVVDSTANTITVNSHNFITGEEVTYSIGKNGTAIQGLTPGTPYFAIVNNGSTTTFQLADTLAHAEAGKALPINGTGANGSQTFTPVQGSTTPSTFKVAAVNKSAGSINLVDHGYVTGEAVTYTVASGGTALNGLTSGTIYYVIALDGNNIQLALSPGNAMSGVAIPISVFGASGVGTLTPVTTTFDPSAVTSAYSITMPNHGFTTGEGVTYAVAAGGTAIGRLTSGTVYYVIVIDSNTIQLASAKDNIPADVAVPINAAGASGAQTLTPVASTFNPSAVNAANSLTLPNHGFFNGEAVIYTTSGTPIAGLNSNTVYYVIALDSNTIQLAATPSDEQNRIPVPIGATGANGSQSIAPVPTNFTATAGKAAYTLTLPNHGFSNGEEVTYTYSGSAISPLHAGQPYWIIVVDPNTIQFAASPSDAQSANPIKIDLTNTFGTQTLTPAAISFTPTAVNSADSINLPNHTLTTGESVTYTVASGGTAIRGLTSGLPYYVIVVDGNNIQLATSLANAQNGVPVLIDETGASGKQSLTLAATSLNLAGVHPASNISLPNHGFATGEAVTYTVASGGTAIPQLTPNEIYYVIAVDSNNIQLALSAGDAANGVAIPISDLNASGTQTLSPLTNTFNPIDVASAYSIAMPDHGFTTGEAVTYSVSTGSTPITGLNPGPTPYYIIAVDANTIELASSAALAQAGTALPIDATTATGGQTFTPVQGTGQTFQLNAVSNGPGTINLPGNDYSTGEAVIYTCTGTPLTNLTSGTKYFVISVDTDTIQLAYSPTDATNGKAIPISAGAASGTQTLTPVGTSFSATAVSAGDYTITLPGHGFTTGEAVTYTTSGTAIGQLTPGAVYNVIVVDANTIKLAASFGAANDAVPLPIDPSTASGNQTLTPVASTFAPSVVGSGTGAITLPAHGFVTGQPITYSVGSGGTAIQGLKVTGKP
jgi:hypothetical protein